MTTLMGCHFLNQQVVEPQHYKTYIEYVVFYPGYKDTVSTNVDDCDFYSGSEKGTNYIGYEHNYIYQNSAPFKILKKYKENLDDNNK